MAPLDLTLSDLGRSNSKSLSFSGSASRKLGMLCHMLLLKINRKPHMGSPLRTSHLTLSDHDIFKSKVNQILKPCISNSRYVGSIILLNTS